MDWFLWDVIIERSQRKNPMTQPYQSRADSGVPSLKDSLLSIEQIEEIATEDENEERLKEYILDHWWDAVNILDSLTRERDFIVRMNDHTQQMVKDFLFDIRANNITK